MPPYEYFLGKLCRAFEKTPWEIDPEIEKGDLHAMMNILDILSYEDAWKQYVSNPGDFGDADKIEMIENVRDLMLELWPSRK